MKKIVFVFIFLGSLVFQSWAQSTDDLDLSTFIHPVDSTAFIRDAGYYNWCNSFIKDDSGTYHLFYSRWPKSLGFTAWLTHSEIAHATASRLEGPYQYQETVLKGRAGFWDAVTAHNVQVRCWNNQYYFITLQPIQEQKTGLIPFCRKLPVSAIRMSGGMICVIIKEPVWL